MPVRFEDRTVEYIVTDDIRDGRPIEGRTNPDTWKLMKEGYVVLKNFIPKDIITFAMDSWKRMELDPEMSPHLYLEDDIIQNSPEETKFKSNGMWNSPWGVALHHWIWRKLKDHIDMDLRETYSYTRKYRRGAYLKAHADRPSCEISGTLCLDYISDDNSPWSIWIDNSDDWIEKPSEIYEGTQAIPITRRKNSKKIDLEVGDLMLYQGPNVAHWRDKFMGTHSYHIFVHFININSKMINMPGMNDIKDKYIPQEMKERHDHFSAEYNPFQFDGRESRYLPRSTLEATLEDTWEGKLFDEAMELWHNWPRVWPDIERKWFINNYESLKLKEEK